MGVSPELENWVQQATPWFRNAGASENAAPKFARAYAATWAAGLQPRIASIFRDPAHQRALQARWDRGDHTGLRARPADPDTSKHSRTGFFGRPASEAIDMPTLDDKRAAQIARSVGLGTGESFRQPDPGHYYR